MNNIVRTIASSIMILLTPISAFAASSGSDTLNNENGIDEKQGVRTEYIQGDSNMDTSVYATVDDGELIVSLPSKVILGGKANENGYYEGDFSISVKGDMASNELALINIEDGEIDLNQKGKNSVKANISQSLFTFFSDDFKNENSKEGSIRTNTLTAGSWNGEMNFIIQVYDKKSVLENEDVQPFGISSETDLTSFYVRGYPAITSDTMSLDDVTSNFKTSYNWIVGSTSSSVINYTGAQSNGFKLGLKRGGDFSDTAAYLIDGEDEYTFNYNHITGNAILGVFYVDLQSKALYLPMMEYVGITNQYWNNKSFNSVYLNNQKITVNNGSIKVGSSIAKLIRSDGSEKEFNGNVNQLLYQILVNACKLSY